MKKPRNNPSFLIIPKIIKVFSHIFLKFLVFAALGIYINKNYALEGLLGLCLTIYQIMVSKTQLNRKRIFESIIIFILDLSILGIHHDPQYGKSLDTCVVKAIKPIEAVKAVEAVECKVFFILRLKMRRNYHHPHHHHYFNQRKR